MENLTESTSDTRRHVLANVSIFSGKSTVFEFSFVFQIVWQWVQHQAQIEAESGQEPDFYRFCIPYLSPSDEKKYLAALLLPPPPPIPGFCEAVPYQSSLHPSTATASNYHNLSTTYPAWPAPAVSCKSQLANIINRDGKRTGFTHFASQRHHERPQESRAHSDSGFKPIIGVLRKMGIFKCALEPLFCCTPDILLQAEEIEERVLKAPGNLERLLYVNHYCFTGSEGAYELYSSSATCIFRTVFPFAGIYLQTSRREYSR